VFLPAKPGVQLRQLRIEEHFSWIVGYPFFSFFIFSSSSALSFFSQKGDSQLPGGEQFDLAELHKSSYTFRKGSSIQVP